VKSVDQAGSTMGAVVESVESVAGLTGRISVAATDQAAGIGRISAAIAHVDEITRENARLVDESAAASDVFQKRAQTLVRAVQIFRLTGRSADCGQEALQRAEHEIGALGHHRVPAGRKVTLRASAIACARPRAAFGGVIWSRSPLTNRAGHWSAYARSRPPA
jgi:hypothetical protein